MILFFTVASVHITQPDRSSILGHERCCPIFPWAPFDVRAIPVRRSDPAPISQAVSKPTPKKSAQKPKPTPKKVAVKR